MKVLVNVPILVTLRKIIVSLIDYHKNILERVNDHSFQRENTNDEISLESPKKFFLLISQRDRRPIILRNYVGYLQ